MRADVAKAELTLSLINVCVAPGAPSSAVVRRLKLLTQCAAELSSAGAIPDAAGAAAAVRRFQAAVLGELPALAAEPGEAVRKHAAECALAHI